MLWIFFGTREVTRASNNPGETDENEEKIEEESLSDVVSTIATELGRSASDAEEATKILKQNWIDDLETFHEVTKSSKNTFGLPIALFHKLKNYKKKEKKEPKNKEEKEVDEKDEKEAEKDRRIH